MFRNYRRSETECNSEVAIILTEARREGRILAAVAFLDVVNFTAIMAENETRTHRLWTRLRETIVEPTILDHGGICVKSTGDGVLARFASALGAVEWADRVTLAMQQEQSGDVENGPIVEARIAVHLGEVITTANDIFGECVNYAARLLEHAQPSGVVMSEAVYNLVKTSAGARARDIGLVRLKSYDAPAQLFELAPTKPRLARSPARFASLPSLAVLPLTNLGAGEPDDYFAEGIVEDVIVSLSALGDILVVARASTLSFRGLNVDPRAVGRALGVRYVLTGTMQRSQASIRIHWQLCHAEDGVVIWNERDEVPAGGLFEIQDRVVRRIVTGLAPTVRTAELQRAMRKRPESFTAYDHMLRGLHLLGGLDPDRQRSAYDCLRDAMNEDPTYAMPFAWAAWWQVLAVGQAIAPDPVVAIEEAGALAAHAIELDGANAMALAIYGHVKSYLFHQYDIGLQYLDRAVSAGPSNAWAWTFSALSLAYTDQGEQSVAHAEHALLLSPLGNRGRFPGSHAAVAA